MKKISTGILSTSSALLLNKTVDDVAALRNLRVVPPMRLTWSNGSPIIQNDETWLPICVMSGEQITSGLASGDQILLSSGVPAASGAYLSGQYVYYWKQQTFDQYGNRTDETPGISGGLQYNPLFETRNKLASFTSGPIYSWARFRGNVVALGQAFEFDVDSTGTGGSSVVSGRFNVAGDTSGGVLPIFPVNAASGAIPTIFVKDSFVTNGGVSGNPGATVQINIASYNVNNGLVNNGLQYFPGAKNFVRPSINSGNLFFADSYLSINPAKSELGVCPNLDGFCQGSGALISGNTQSQVRLYIGAGSQQEGPVLHKGVTFPLVISHVTGGGFSGEGPAYGCYIPAGGGELAIGNLPTFFNSVISFQTLFVGRTGTDALGNTFIGGTWQGKSEFSSGLSVSGGGTGTGTFTSGGILVGNGTNALSTIGPGVTLNATYLKDLLGTTGDLHFSRGILVSGT